MRLIQWLLWRMVTGYKMRLICESIWDDYYYAYVLTDHFSWDSVEIHLKISSSTSDSLHWQNVSLTF
jgi:hypothetical protein